MKRFLSPPKIEFCAVCDGEQVAPAMMLTSPATRAKAFSSFTDLLNLLREALRASEVLLRNCLIIKVAVREGFEPSVTFWATAL